MLTLRCLPLTRLAWRVCVFYNLSVKNNMLRTYNLNYIIIRPTGIIEETPKLNRPVILTALYKPTLPLLFIPPI